MNDTDIVLSQDFCAQRHWVKHGQGGVDIEGTVFVTTTTTAVLQVPREMSPCHTNTNSRHLCVIGQLGSGEKARPYGPKVDSLKANQNQRIKTMKASQSFSGRICIQMLLFRMRAGRDEIQMEGSRHVFLTDSLV